MDNKKYGTIYTYAAKIGQRKPQGQAFSSTLTQHIESFLVRGNGSFSLVESLLKISPKVAETEINGVNEDI